MYVGGRERSLRASAEFAGALGANVGAAMLLREGARAILKFFPGWGNVGVRPGRRLGNVRDWSRCDCVFYRRRLTERMRVAHI